MIGHLKKILESHKQGILYLFFGGLTTLVNYVVYVVCCYFLTDLTTAVPNFIAWVVSVLFAYFTNRVWVFASKAHTLTDRFREFCAFSGSRIATLLLETVCLWVTVDYLGWNNYIMKLAANVVVIVLNYVFSKYWVFRQTRRQ